MVNMDIVHCTLKSKSNGSKEIFFKQLTKVILWYQGREYLVVACPYRGWI